MGHDIESLTLVPDSGGVYEIFKDDQLIFSKTELGRFPSNDQEILDKL